MTRQDEIRGEYEAGRTATEIARRYGITRLDDRTRLTGGEIQNVETPRDSRPALSVPTSLHRRGA